MSVTFEEYYKQVREELINMYLPNVVIEDVDALLEEEKEWRKEHFEDGYSVSASADCLSMM